MKKQKNVVSDSFVAIECALLVLAACAGGLFQLGKVPLPQEYAFPNYPWFPLAIYSFFGFFVIALIRYLVVAAQMHKPKREVVIERRAAIPETRYKNNVSENNEDTHVKNAIASGQTAQIVLDELQSRPKDVEELLASIVFFMRKNFDAYSALGFIYNPNREVFVLNAVHTRSIAVIEDIEIAKGLGIVGRIAVDRKSFLSGDILMYGEQVVYYKQGEVVNTVLAVPIISEEKELLGALVIDSKDKRAFSDSHKDIMRRFSGLAAALIINARMRIYQQRTASQFKTFYENSQQLTTALTSEDVFNVLFSTIGLLVAHSRIMVISVNASANSLRIARISGTKTDIEQGFEFPIGGGLYSFVYQKKKIVNIGAYASGGKEYYRFTENESHDQAPVSLIIIPLLDNEYRCLGLISIESENRGQYVGESETLLSILMGNASVALARAMLYQKMERLATTDGLTGLPNHRYFQDQLTNEVDRAKRYNRNFSLLLLDIDHFKKFNDTHGHTVGDLVLREVAQCIRSAIRSSDFPARYGGEEFIVILAESSVEGAIATAERIRTTVENHKVMHGELPLSVTVSIGYASCPPHLDDRQYLINMADKALYYSKEHGRNKVTMYDQSMANGKT